MSSDAEPEPARSWVVRDVAERDLAGLKAVIDATGLFPSPMLDDMVRGYLDGAAEQEIWVTVDDGRPVAVGYCAPERMTDGTWNMLLIAVDPSAQGRGVGAAIMRHVEGQLSAKGARILIVETSGLPEFEATRRFYLGIGYAEEARIRDFYQAGEDKIVFRKPLRPGSDASGEER